MPPKSCGVFQVTDSYSMEDLIDIFKNSEVHEEEIHKKDTDLSLQILVDDFQEKNGNITGTIAYEYPISLNRVDGTIRWEKDAKRIKFTFLSDEGFIYFVPFAKREEGENIAGKLNAIYFNSDVLLKLRFPERVIENFLDRNPYKVKRSSWGDLDIPGVSRSSLSGSEVMRSSDSDRYDEHGETEWIMIELEENGWTVLISQKGSITFYTDVTKDEMIDFIKNRIFPLMSS